MAGAVERVYPGSPIASNGSRLIAAPFQFVTTGTEFLRVTVVNSQSNVIVQVHARILRPSGEIVPQAWDHTPATDRSASSQDFHLGAGALLTLTVVASSASPLVGQTYVILKLVQGVGVNAIVLGTLLAGYVTTTQALGWPGSPIQDSITGGGVIRTIVGTDPAAGADVSETVPTGARWEILTVWSTLFTSVAAGNRFAVLTYFSGANHLIQSAHPNAQGPGAQGQYSWGPGYTAALVTASLVYQAPLPIGVPLLAGENFALTLINQDVGDDWQAPRYQVREWLEAA